MGIPIIAPYLEKPKIDQLKGGFVVRYFGLTDKDGHFVHSNGDSSECPVYGFYIASDKEPIRLVYITDAEFCKFRFSDINSLLIGINYMDSLVENEEEIKKRHVLNGHMSLDTAKEFIKTTDRKHTLDNVIVCHMSDSNSDIPTFEKEIRKVTECNIHFARKGKVINL